MRRGGIVILLIGIIVALAAAGLLFFILSQPSGIANGPIPTPTEDLGVEVVHARVEIPANTVISDTTVLELQSIPSSVYNAQPNAYFLSIGEVQDKLTTNVIGFNTAVRQGDLIDPGLSQQIPTAEPDRPRDKAYPLSVNSLSGVADQINSGDLVDVVATFSIPRRISYATGQQIDQDQASQQREFLDDFLTSTKTIVQQVQVLRVARPAVPADATPGPATAEEGPPETDAEGRPVEEEQPADQGATFTEGSWVLIVAVNDQEAELIEFALNTEADITLVLRGAGDEAFETTIGATFDLLVSEFGVPAPQPIDPFVLSAEDSFIPDPTRTPAPTRVP